MPADEKPAVSVAAMTSDSGEDRSSSQSSGSAVKKRVTIFENKMMSDDPNNNNNNNSSNSKIVASSPAKVKIDLRSSGKPASSSEVGIVEGKLPSPTFKVCMIVFILCANGGGAYICDVEFLPLNAPLLLKSA